MSDNEPQPSTSRRIFLAGSAATLGVGVVTGPAVAASEHHHHHHHRHQDQWPDGPGRRNRPQEPYHELRSILAEIDRHRIEANVRRLVSFGTRHTLST